MKKNFSACVYTATAKAAKVINIEVNVFLNAEGAPVPGVYFAALNPGEITVFIEFNGVLFLFRTYQEETFYFRENELGAFLGAIASDVPGFEAVPDATIQDQYYLKENGRVIGQMFIESLTVVK